MTPQPIRSIRTSPRVSPSTVLVNGCFDPFHVGHLYHFQAARKLGDTLIVAVTKNGYVHKGKGRPMFDEEERAAVLRALAIIDEVILVESSIEALAAIKPAVWCIGEEYRNKVREDDALYCRQWGIKLVFTNEKTYSSTKICDLLRQG